VGQKQGYGWTQAWMTDADGGNRKLVLGEDGKHIYGSDVSPDGKYLMFARADTDGGLDSAIMGLMRISDAPMVRGESVALRKVHPDARNGVILDLTQGWEPHWTFAKLGAK
jgi:dipeptidyl aminopeptidase/acylaminoacyl peptidase